MHAAHRQVRIFLIAGIFAVFFGVFLPLSSPVVHADADSSSLSADAACKSGDYTCNYKQGESKTKPGQQCREDTPCSSNGGNATGICIAAQTCKATQVKTTTGGETAPKQASPTESGAAPVMPTTDALGNPITTSAPVESGTPAPAVQPSTSNSPQVQTNQQLQQMANQSILGLTQQLFNPTPAAQQGNQLTAPSVTSNDFSPLQSLPQGSVAPTMPSDIPQGSFQQPFGDVSNQDRVDAGSTFEPSGQLQPSAPAENSFWGRVTGAVSGYFANLGSGMNAISASDNIAAAPSVTPIASADDPKVIAASDALIDANATLEEKQNDLSTVKANEFMMATNLATVEQQQGMTIADAQKALGDAQIAADAKAAQLGAVQTPTYNINPATGLPITNSTFVDDPKGYAAYNNSDEAKALNAAQQTYQALATANNALNQATQISNDAAAAVEQAKADVNTAFSNSLQALGTNQANWTALGQSLNAALTGAQNGLETIQEAQATCTLDVCPPIPQSMVDAAQAKVAAAQADIASYQEFASTGDRSALTNDLVQALQNANTPQSPTDSLLRSVEPTLNNLANIATNNYLNTVQQQPDLANFGEVGYYASSPPSPLGNLVVGGTVSAIANGAASLGEMTGALQPDPASSISCDINATACNFNRGYQVVNGAVALYTLSPVTSPLLSLTEGGITRGVDAIASEVEGTVGTNVAGAVGTDLTSQAAPALTDAVAAYKTEATSITQELATAQASGATPAEVDAIASKYAALESATPPEVVAAARAVEETPISVTPTPEVTPTSLSGPTQEQLAAITDLNNAQAQLDAANARAIENGVAQNSATGVSVPITVAETSPEVLAAEQKLAQLGLQDLPNDRYLVQATGEEFQITRTPVGAGSTAAPELTISDANAAVVKQVSPELQAQAETAVKEYENFVANPIKNPSAEPDVVASVQAGYISRLEEVGLTPTGEGSAVRAMTPEEIAAAQTQTTPTAVVAAPTTKALARDTGVLAVQQNTPTFAANISDALQVAQVNVRLALGDVASGVANTLNNVVSKPLESVFGAAQATQAVLSPVATDLAVARPALAVSQTVGVTDANVVRLTEASWVNSPAVTTATGETTLSSAASVANPFNASLPVSYLTGGVSQALNTAYAGQSAADTGATTITPEGESYTPAPESSAVAAAPSPTSVVQNTAAPAAPTTVNPSSVAPAPSTAPAAASPTQASSGSSPSPVSAGAGPQLSNTAGIGLSHILDYLNPVSSAEAAPVSTNASIPALQQKIQSTINTANALGSRAAQTQDLGDGKAATRAVGDVINTAEQIAANPKISPSDAQNVMTAARSVIALQNAMSAKLNNIYTLYFTYKGTGEEFKAHMRAEGIQLSNATNALANKALKALANAAANPTLPAPVPVNQPTDQTKVTPPAPLPSAPSVFPAPPASLTEAKPAAAAPAPAAQNTTPVAAQTGANKVNVSTPAGASRIAQELAAGTGISADQAQSIVAKNPIGAINAINAISTGRGMPEAVTALGIDASHVDQKALQTALVTNGGLSAQAITAPGASAPAQTSPAAPTAVRQMVSSAVAPGKRAFLISQISDPSTARVVYDFYGIGGSIENTIAAQGVGQQFVNSKVNGVLVVADIGNAPGYAGGNTAGALGTTQGAIAFDSEMTGKIAALTGIAPAAVAAMPRSVIFYSGGFSPGTAMIQGLGNKVTSVESLDGMYGNTPQVLLSWMQHTPGAALVSECISECALNTQLAQNLTSAGIPVNTDLTNIAKGATVTSVGGTHATIVSANNPIQNFLAATGQGTVVPGAALASRAPSIPGLISVAPGTVGTAASPVIVDKVNANGGTFTVAPGTAKELIPTLAAKQVQFAAAALPQGASLKTFVARPSQGAPLTPSADQIAQQVMDSLYASYQAAPHVDSGGAFGYKDVLAAQQDGNKTLEQEVIGGMNPDFQKRLYGLIQAAAAQGITIGINSGYRGDYRQSLITDGVHAPVGGSNHGGGRTGGYGTGIAADLVGVKGTSDEAAWNFIDQNGAQFGVSRPLPGNDPSHTQSTGGPRAISVQVQNLRSYDLIDPQTGQVVKTFSLPQTAVTTGPVALADKLNNSPALAAAKGDGRFVIGNDNKISILKPDGSQTLFGTSPLAPALLKNALDTGVSYTTDNKGNFFVNGAQVYLRKVQPVAPNIPGEYNPASAKAVLDSVNVACKIVSCNASVLGPAAVAMTAVESRVNSFAAHPGSQYQGLGQLGSSETVTSINTWSRYSLSPNISAADQAQIRTNVAKANAMLQSGQNPNTDPVLGAWLLIGNHLAIGDMPKISAVTSDPRVAAAYFMGAQFAPVMYGGNFGPGALLSPSAASAFSGQNAGFFWTNMSLGQATQQLGVAYGSLFDRGIALANRVSSGGFSTSGGGGGGGGGGGSGGANGGGPDLVPGSVGAPDGPAFDPNVSYRIVDGNGNVIGGVIAGTALGGTALILSTDQNGNPDGKTQAEVSTKSTDGSGEVAVAVDADGNVITNPDGTPKFVFDPTKTPPGTWSPDGSTYTVAPPPPPNANPWSGRSSGYQSQSQTYSPASTGSPTQAGRPSGGASGGGSQPQLAQQPAPQSQPFPQTQQPIPTQSTTPQPPQFSCSPTTAIEGATTTVTLTWSCASGVAVSNTFPTGQSPWGTTNIVINQNATSTIQLSAACALQSLVSVPAQCSINIVQPTVSLIANPSIVASGATTMLSWSSINTTSCRVLSPNGVQIGSTAAGGSASSFALSTTTVFTALCQTTGQGVTVSASTTVTVH